MRVMFIVTGSVAMVGGLLVTMVLRQTLGLVQTGRVLQYAGFWVASLAGVQAAGLFFDETFIMVNPFLSALAIFAVAFGAATAAGEIPWKGRTWLPVKRSN